jgi:hypothetical protein
MSYPTDGAEDSAFICGNHQHQRGQEAEEQQRRRDNNS